MNYKHFFFWTREFKTMYASMQKVYFFVLHIAITSNWNSFLYIIKTHGNFKWYEIKFVNTMHKDTRVVTSSKILNFYQNWPICIKTSLTAQKTNQVVWHFAASHVANLFEVIWLQMKFTCNLEGWAWGTFTRSRKKLLYIYIFIIR